MTLSCDQNKMFGYLVLKSLLLTAYFRKFNCQKIFFYFSTFDFYGLIIVYTSAFPLWRGQKYHRRRTLIFCHPMTVSVLLSLNGSFCYCQTKHQTPTRFGLMYVTNQLETLLHSNRLVARGATHQPKSAKRSTFTNRMGEGNPF